jgi:thymidylate synthase
MANFDSAVRAAAICIATPEATLASNSKTQLISLPKVRRTRSSTCGILSGTEMYFTAQTLDDLMRIVLQHLLSRKGRVSASRGPMSEATGVLLKLTNPRARLSRSVVKGTVFSCLGEFLWYLSKGKALDFISYYIPAYLKESEDMKSVFGGYGPRLFDMHGVDNQIENVLGALKHSPSSRRAVIQIFDSGDIAQRRLEVPCTCTLQFLIRRGRLEMFSTMRSNDAFKGLPHDVFAFTMLQEIFARSLDVEVGSYKHAVGSLHLYEDEFQKAEQYLDEGWQASVPMPAMPPGDPWKAIQNLLRLEKRVRLGRGLSDVEAELPGYWQDFGRLLQIFKYSKENGNGRKVARLRKLMTSKVFNTYILRREMRKLTPPALRQMEIPFMPPILAD